MHRIEKNDKIVGTYLQWHGLNDVVEVITRQNNPLCVGTNPTGWDVEKRAMTIAHKGKQIATPFSILVGSDNGEPIGLPIAESYGILDNAEFVDCVENCVASVPGIKCVIESSGSVRNRGRTFMAVKIGDETDKFVVDGREFKSHLNFLNSFDKSCQLTVLDSNVCTVCDNTFSMNLENNGSALNVRIVHRKGIKAAIKDVPILVHAAITGRKNFAAKLSRFSSFPVSLVDAESIFAHFIGKGNENVVLSTRAANIVKRLTELFTRGKGNKGETMLDVFQAVTEYYTHENAGESDNKFKQFESSEFGTGAESKSEFFAALCGMIETKEKFTGVARVGNKILVAYRNKPAKA